MLPTFQTSASNETTLTLDTFLEAKKMLEEKYPKPFEAILVTKRPIIPHGEAWQKEYKGKKYIMMGWGSFMQLSQFLDKTLVGGGYAYNMPVVEDDELMIKIITEAICQSQ